MKKSILVPVALVCFLGAAHAETPSQGKPQAAGVLGQKQQRTILSKTDLQTAPGYEAIVLTVDGAPGLVGKKHFHPGDEFIYLADGTLTLDIAGRGKVTLHKGETVHLPGGVVHQAVNPSKDMPFKAVTFGIFEKGKPDTTIVTD
ncbi:MAG: cupin domain-containing protein [Chromatiales bacterium]|nr:cupin domain-containing protein [Chromatiales bacterium]